MGSVFYKYTPAVLAGCGLIYGTSGYFLNEYLAGGWNLVFWLLFTLCQVFIGLVFGALIRELHRRAYKDALTGLLNRRYFYKGLAGEILRMKRTKTYLALALIDIDNFKYINDQFGHLAGDQVLKQLAAILQKNTRAIDIVARWGGEEFAVILPETRGEGAFVLAERLRETVESYPFCSRITVSIGIAAAQGETEPDRLVALADQALYRAKEKKNAVVMVGELIPVEKVS